jgi:hypothetical protein
MARDINIKIGATDSATAVFNSVARSLTNVDKKLTKVSTSVTSAGTSLIKFGGVTAGLVGGAFAGFIKAASDSEETMSKFAVVFGESTEQMSKWSSQAAGDLGVAEDAMAGMLSGMQDLLVPMGVVPESAEEMSKTLSTLAVDLGSFNNMSTDKTFEDLQAAMTGSGEVMKKYGVILSEASVKQELLNKGLDPKVATDAQKAQARLTIIMRGTTAAQGDAIRTAGGFANQVKRLGAITRDVSGMIGAVFIDDMSTVIGRFTEAAKWVKGFVAENQQLVRIAGGVAAAITGIGVAAAGIGVSLIAAGAAIGAVGTIATAAGAAITAALSPVILVVAGLTVGAALMGVAFGIVAYKTGLLEESMGRAMHIMGSMLEVAKETGSGIATALSTGDWELAAKIGMAGVKVAFWTGLQEVHKAFILMLPKIWITVRDFLLKIVQEATRTAAYLVKVLTSPSSLASDGLAKFTIGTSITGSKDSQVAFGDNEVARAKIELAQLIAEANRNVNADRAPAVDRSSRSMVELISAFNRSREENKDQSAKQSETNKYLDEMLRKMEGDNSLRVELIN